MDRVWFNGALVIDHFVAHSPTVDSSAVGVLSAGQAYPIRIDFYENSGSANAHLAWSSASTPTQIVPQSRLAH